MWNRAIAWGYTDSNPWKGIGDNPDKSRDRFLQAGELPRLFAALEGKRSTNDALDRAVRASVA